MDQPEMHPQSDSGTPPPPTFGISPAARSYWPGTRNWSLFMAIMGFILAALIGLVMALVLHMAFRSANYLSSQVSTVLYIYTALLIGVLIVSILLLMFSNSLSRAGRYGHPGDVKCSSLNLLRYFRVLAILAVGSLIMQVWWVVNTVNLLNKLPF